MHEYPDLAQSELFNYYPRMEELKDSYKGKNIEIFDKDLAKSWCLDYLYNKMTSKAMHDKYGVLFNDPTGFIIGNTRVALRLELKSKANDKFNELDESLAKKLISDHVELAWEECGYKLYK